MPAVHGARLLARDARPEWILELRSNYSRAIFLNFAGTISVDKPG
jgi:hypothetical protein